MSLHSLRNRVLSSSGVALLIVGGWVAVFNGRARSHAEAAQPAPPAATAPPATRPAVIEAGDLLCVGVLGLDTNDVETLKTVRVNPQGAVRLYYVGTLKVGGLSYGDAERLIGKAYRDGKYVSQAGVTVNLLPSAKDAPAGAVISPGDRLSVKVFDLSPSGVTTRLLTVNSAGTVGLPFLGQTPLAGLSEEDAEKLIARQYQDAGVMRQARISVLRLSPDETMEPTVEPLSLIVLPAHTK